MSQLSEIQPTGQTDRLRQSETQSQIRAMISESVADMTANISSIIDDKLSMFQSQNPYASASSASSSTDRFEFIGRREIRSSAAR